MGRGTCTHRVNVIRQHCRMTPCASLVPRNINYQKTPEHLNRDSTPRRRCGGHRLGRMLWAGPSRCTRSRLNSSALHHSNGASQTTAASSGWPSSRSPTQALRPAPTALGTTFETESGSQLVAETGGLIIEDSLRVPVSGHRKTGEYRRLRPAFRDHGVDFESATADELMRGWPAVHPPRRRDGDHYQKESVSRRRHQGRRSARSRWLRSRGAVDQGRQPRPRAAVDPPRLEV